MSFSTADHRHMAEALRLAARGEATTDPNPRVGCVIVNKGRIVGHGWHQRAGEAHAEIVALGEAGAGARGATCYVSLEPCSHHGRTPPCAEALIEAGVGAVVVAAVDPNPAVAGRGIACLTRAGITVRTGLMEQPAVELNIGFFSRQRRHKPWVRLKLAASLDGRTAAADGDARWITGAAARDDVQQWRARASAVLTGVGTVLADDPGLNVRLPGSERQPLRIVLDSSFRTPPAAQLLALPGPALIVGCQPPPARRARGEWISLAPDAAGRVDLVALMRLLVRREVNELHVEAGPTLAGALLAVGLVDELLLYQAAVLLGDRGRPLASLPGMEKMDHRLHLTPVDARRVGADWRFRFRLTGWPGEGV